MAAAIIQSDTKLTVVNGVLQEYDEFHDAAWPHETLLQGVLHHVNVNEVSNRYAYSVFGSRMGH
jgi:ketopantoate reductase